MKKTKRANIDELDWRLLALTAGGLSVIIGAFLGIDSLKMLGVVIVLVVFIEIVITRPWRFS